MKTIDEFLIDLSNLDVKLWLEGDRLCCNAPEEILTSSLSSQLAERKEEIIAFLNRANSTSSSRRTIKPVARTENLPLSFAQQRLWFIEHMTPNSPQYNIFEAIRFEGVLDVSALRRSINEIIRRHEILRTNFKTLEGQSIQEIAPSLELPLPIIDW